MSDIQPDPYIDTMAAEHIQEYDPEVCSDPPAESCSDAGCPVHGWEDEDDPYGPEEADRLAGLLRDDLGFWPEHAHELNPPPQGDPALDMLCRGGDHTGCVGPPGTTCECSCHARRTRDQP